MDPVSIPVIPQSRAPRLVMMRIADIHVGERIRRDMGDIKGLAENIRLVGLLHPIVVTENGTLVVGAKRLEAVKFLRWTEIPATILESNNDEP